MMLVKSQTRARVTFLLLGLMQIILIYSLKIQFFGRRNLGDIQLVDVESISGLICQIFFQSRKEVTND